MEGQEPRNVYALLIGIDRYRADLPLPGGLSLPALRGCVQDAHRLAAYLADDPACTFHPMILADEKATRGAVVDAFRKHLGQAGPEDTALVYFSGHGAVEDAAPGLWQEPRLECIVCYPETPHPPGFLLADKELRILLKDLYDTTRCHIAAIFDCCHAGDNTREAAVRQEDVGSVQRKQAAHVFPARSWEEFLFAGRFRPEQFAGRSMNEVIAQAPHIQFAAAEKDEAALQVNGSGLFTTFLLKALTASRGNLSYRDLFHRVRNPLRIRYTQRPNLYTPDGAEDLRELGFLGRTVDPGTATASMVYNMRLGWIADKGYLHGVVPGSSVQLPAAGPDSPAYPVRDIGLDQCGVQVTGLDYQKTYALRLSGLSLPTVTLHLVSRDLPPKDVHQLMDILEQDTGLAVTFTDVAAGADYALEGWRDMLYLTLPGNDFRPLHRPIASFRPDDPDGGLAAAGHLLCTRLHQLATWKRFRQLHNPGPDSLPEDTLGIRLDQLYADGTESALHPGPDRTVEIRYEPTPGGSKRWGGRIRIRVRNRHPRTKLYIAALYLSEDGAIRTNLLEPTVWELPPGAEKTLRDHRNGIIRMSPEARTYWYDAPFSTDTLLVVAGSEPFEADQIAQEPLPAPPDPDQVRAAAILEGRQPTAENDSASIRPPVLSGWQTYRLDLRFVNPEYRRIRPSDLAELVGDASQALADFGIALYGRQQGFDPALTFDRPGAAAARTVLPSAPARKAAFRRQQASRRRQLSPDRSGLLVAGDSWIIHPTRKDLADQLAGYLPVHHLFTAEGQPCLTIPSLAHAIPHPTPVQALLYSDGGDLLRPLLPSRPPSPATHDQASLPPGFHQAWTSFEERLEDLYRRMSHQFPHLTLLLHGYDYFDPHPAGIRQIPPVFSPPTEDSGAADELWRTRICQIVDAWNERLADWVQRHPAAVHCDLRGSHPAGAWWDELHPDDAGFQEMGLRILAKLA